MATLFNDRCRFDLVFGGGFGIGLTVPGSLGNTHTMLVFCGIPGVDHAMPVVLEGAPVNLECSTPGKIGIGVGALPELPVLTSGIFGKSGIEGADGSGRLMTVGIAASCWFCCGKLGASGAEGFGVCGRLPDPCGKPGCRGASTSGAVNDTALKRGTCTGDVFGIAGTVTSINGAISACVPFLF